MDIFWQRWLMLWCVGIGAFGLVLYGVGFPATTSGAAAIFSALGNQLPSEPDRYLRFAISLMGAVTAGWAVTYYAAFRAAWKLAGEARAATWRLLTTGALAWYAIDSVASIANGFPLNAVSNTVLIILYLVPVVATRVLSAANLPSGSTSATDNRRVV